MYLPRVLPRTLHIRVGLISRDICSAISYLNRYFHASDPGAH
jgi:hypothetical protein